MILNNIFDAIYVINIDSEVDKWKLVKSELERNHITNYTRFSGVIIDGESTVKSRNLGCTTSHVNIIKEVKRLGKENVLIFEDDVMFDDRIHDYIDIINNFIKDNVWDLFYLGGNHEGNVEKVNDNIMRVNKTKTTHAYAINKTCFDNIINWNINMPVDDMLIKHIQRKKNSYCIYPRLALQRPGYSNIMNGFRDHTKVLKDDESI